ncbi:MAG: hypothetical protein WD604_08575 [Balneolaceae bacterium]
MIPAKKIFDFYINSSIHVALAVTAFTGITLLNFEISPDAGLLLFIFFGTVTGYNFVKYAGIAKFHQLDDLSKNLRVIFSFSMLCLAGMIYYALQQPVSVIIAAGLMGVITLLYALPVYREQNIRSFTGVKIFVIAFVWAGVTVILPVTGATGINWHTDVFLEFIQRVLFVIVLTLPFEIRDLRFDSVQLGTIPQLIGIRKTRIAGIVILLAVVLTEFFKEHSGAGEMAVLVFAAILTAVLVQKSVLRQNRYYASFWVEGVPVVWWVLLFLIKSIV